MSGWGAAARWGDEDAAAGDESRLGGGSGGGLHWPAVHRGWGGYGTRCECAVLQAEWKGLLPVVLQLPRQNAHSHVCRAASILRDSCVNIHLG